MCVCMCVCVCVCMCERERERERVWLWVYRLLREKIILYCRYVCTDGSYLLFLTHRFAQGHVSDISEDTLSSHTQKKQPFLAVIDQKSCKYLAI